MRQLIKELPDRFQAELLSQSNLDFWKEGVGFIITVEDVLNLPIDGVARFSETKEG